MESDLPDFGSNGEIHDIANAGSMDIYSQQLARFNLLSSTEEKILGGRINQQMTAIIRSICNSPAGVDDLSSAMENYFLGYQTANGQATSRWKYDIEPCVVMNMTLTLTDTLAVMLIINEDPELRERIVSNLSGLLNSLSIDRKLLIGIAENYTGECTGLARHIKGYYILRGELIEKNLRLVYSAAGKFSRPGVGYDDLIQEGNIGLLKAADRFTFNKGFRFSTYAFWCIRNVVRTALQKRYYTISRPSYLQEKLSTIKSATVSYSNKNGKQPDIVTLSAMTGISVEVLQKISEFPEEPISFSQSVDEGDVWLDARLPDGSANTAVLAEHKLKRKALAKLCNVLSEREQLVLKMRYGIGCREEHTLQEIAWQLNISIERVRQLQQNALKKLQQQSSIAPLRSDLE